MIKLSYYEQNICQVSCEKYNTEDCCKKFYAEKNKKEKLSSLVCENYQKKEDFEFEKEI